MARGGAEEVGVVMVGVVYRRSGCGVVRVGLV